MFGEELIREKKEEERGKACKKTNASVKDYTVGPIFMNGNMNGGHEWIIEFTQKPENLQYFTELLDNALKAINSDYEAKRYSNMTLKMPVVHDARENLFYDWLKMKKKLGGQNKIPRLSNSRKMIEELKGIM